jgi:hypothetical protein
MGGACCSPPSVCQARKPPTAVARRARLYRLVAGSRQSNLRSDNAGTMPDWRRLRRLAMGQDAVSFARIVKTANASFRLTRQPSGSPHRERCRCPPIPGILLGVLAGALRRAAPDRRLVVAIIPCRYRKAGTAPIPTWQFASAPCPTPCRSTNAGASSHPGGIASTASA